MNLKKGFQWMLFSIGTVLVLYSVLIFVIIFTHKEDWQDFPEFFVFDPLFIFVSGANLILLSLCLYWRDLVKKLEDEVEILKFIIPQGQVTDLKGRKFI